MCLSKSGWVVTALAVVSAWLLAPQAATSLEAVDGPSFPDALLALATLLQLALSMWVLLAVTLALLGSSSHLVRLTTPRLLRHALFAGAAGAIAVTPAYADPHLGPHEAPQHSLSGMKLPDRPSSAATPDLVHTRFSIIVRPGDTLWAIAARSLPPSASAADIAAATSRWHDANRAVIGVDPHLIFPGQQLTPPLGKDRR